MRSIGLSIAGLIALVALLAVGLACLLNASSPWAALASSALLVTLAVAPLVATYRRGPRRASWLGLSLCGTAYVILSSAPGFSGEVAPRLLSTRLLEWAYPLAIPEGRRPPRRVLVKTFSISGRSSRDRVEGLSQETIEGGRIDVIVEGAEAGSPPLAADVQVAGASFGGGSIPSVQVRVTGSQLARLNQARSEGKRLAVRRPLAVQPVGARPVTPVEPEDFYRVGHSFIGIICAALGALLGQYLYFTRDRSASASP